MVKTLVIDNFAGRLTSYPDGDINSGFAYGTNTFGNNPFLKYGNLTWSTEATQIDPTGSVITDLIMAGKERVESGILYVYAVGHTGRVYKIQVNDPASYNPEYDNPVLLYTLTANNPTFTRGGSIDFFGATEKIYIGHDQGVTSLNFNGTGETYVGLLASWVQNVPRPMVQFIGKEYVGNGANLVEIDSTAAVTTYSKLSPGFPTNTQVRDLDINPEGTYLQAVVSRLALPNITVGTQDTSSTASSDSYIFQWNGTDIGYTAYTTFPSFSLSSNIMFSGSQYTFGTDQFGMAMFNPSQKMVSATEELAPLPNAISSTGNLVSWMAPLFFTDHLELTQGYWGSMDFELGTGYWACFGHTATAPQTDIVQVPFQLQVSNFGLGSSSNGYANNVFGTSKVYFSTLETSGAPTTAYRLFKWSPSTSLSLPTDFSTPISGAIYQTQNQIFSKKVQIKQVRIYAEPWISGNSFSMDLIGSAGTPMANGSKTFTAGTNMTIGDDFAWYTPDPAPTYCVGTLITNLGDTNFNISKVEIDYAQAGQ